MILHSHSLYLKDSFSYIIFGNTISNPGWLAQVILAFIHDYGSWIAIKLANGFLFSGAFVIPGLIALKVSRFTRESSLFSVLFAVAIGFLVAASNSSARPQVFAVFCFSILFFIIRSGLRNKHILFIALPLCLFWQNAHPSLSLAIMLLGTESLAGLHCRIIGVCNKDITFIIFLLLMIIPIYFLTPESTNIFNVTANNIIISKEYLGISEWMPPWHRSVFEAMSCFWLIFGFTIYGLFRVGWRGVNLQDLYLSVVFCMLSLYASRFCLFWAIVSIPLWSTLIDSLKPAHLFNWPVNSKITALKAFGVFSLSIMLLSALATISPTLSNQLPLKGVEVLNKTPNVNRVYNYREWGGPLIYTGYPKWTVMIDGRLYLYDLQHWNNYVSEASGKVYLDDIIERHKPSAFFLHPTFHEGLIRQIENTSNWKNIYSDSSCIIYLPLE